MRINYLVVALFIFGACNNNTGSVEQPVVTNTVTPVIIEFVQVTATPIVPTVEPTQQRRDLEDGQPLAARVNNQPLYLDVFQEQVTKFNTVLGDRLPLEQIERQVLDSLLTQLIIEQQAAELGLIVTDAEVEAEINNVLAQMAADDVELWFQKNNLSRSSFLVDLHNQLLADKLFQHITQNVPTAVEQVRLRYIRVDDETTARNVIDQLKQGEAFEQLAATYSLDIAGTESGGDTGWLAQGNSNLPPEVETIAFSLRPNEVSGPIYTSDGLYIIKLEDKDPARLLSDDNLLAYKSKIFTSWLNQQRASAQIERFVALQ